MVYSYRGRRCLVTGGLGFIGSNLTLRLVHLGASVTVVDSLVPGCGANPLNIRPVASDVEVLRAVLRIAAGAAITEAYIKITIGAESDVTTVMVGIRLFERDEDDLIVLGIERAGFCADLGLDVLRHLERRRAGFLDDR